jgi:hypothetical protein
MGDLNNNKLTYQFRLSPLTSSFSLLEESAIYIQKAISAGREHFLDIYTEKRLLIGSFSPFLDHPVN